MSKAETLASTKSTILDIFESSGDTPITKQEQERILSQLRATRNITIQGQEYLLIKYNQLVLFFNKGKSYYQSHDIEIAKLKIIAEDQKKEIRRIQQEIGRKNEEAIRSSQQKVTFLKKIEELSVNNRSLIPASPLNMGRNTSMLIKEAHESDYLEIFIGMTDFILSSIKQLQIEPQNTNKYELQRSNHRSNGRSDFNSSELSYYHNINPGPSHLKEDQSYIDSQGQSMGRSFSEHRHPSCNNSSGQSSDNESEHQRGHLESEGNQFCKRCKFFSGKLDSYQNSTSNIGSKLSNLQKKCELFARQLRVFETQGAPLEKITILLQIWRNQNNQIKLENMAHNQLMSQAGEINQVSNSIPLFNSSESLLNVIPIPPIHLESQSERLRTF